MTDSDRKNIRCLQKQGLGYRRIAAQLGLSENTVKAYCKRHPVMQEVYVDSRCKQCGELLVKKHPSKHFCNDRCRMAWWNQRRTLVKKQTYHQLICEKCGLPFTVYGKPHQRFCSRACYHAYRKAINL